MPAQLLLVSTAKEKPKALKQMLYLWLSSLRNGPGQHKKNGEQAGPIVSLETRTVRGRHPVATSDPIRESHGVPGWLIPLWWENPRKQRDVEDASLQITKCLEYVLPTTAKNPPKKKLIFGLGGIKEHLGFKKRREANVEKRLILLFQRTWVKHAQCGMTFRVLVCVARIPMK